MNLMDVVVNVYYVNPMTDELVVSSWYTCEDDSHWKLNEFKKQYGHLVDGEIIAVSFINGNNINYI